jgi:hypothetical protein
MVREIYSLRCQKIIYFFLLLASRPLRLRGSIVQDLRKTRKETLVKSCSLVPKPTIFRITNVSLRKSYSSNFAGGKGVRQDYR